MQVLFHQIYQVTTLTQAALGHRNTFGFLIPALGIMRTLTSPTSTSYSATVSSNS